MLFKYITHQFGSIQESLNDLLQGNPGWDISKIYEKTGINRRYISTKDETALTLAIKAGRDLIDISKNVNIDGLIYISQSPTSVIPGDSITLHSQLNLPKASFIFDLNQGCSGFIYGLSLALSQLSLLNLESCLIICSDTYTKNISSSDRTCRPIFSDAASAILVNRDDLQRVCSFIFHTDGSGRNDLKLDTTTPQPTLFMNGPSVLSFTIKNVPQAVNSLLKQSNLKLEEIDMFIFHQASQIVLDHIQNELKVDNEKFFRYSSSIGNTVSSSIPIAIKQAQDSGLIESGMKIMLMGFGVGYSLAGCIINV